MAAAWVYRTPAGHLEEAEGPWCHPWTKDDRHRSDVFTDLMLGLHLAAAAFFSSKSGRGTSSNPNVPLG